MPRYFFDIDDGRRRVRDEQGKVFLDQFTATSEAVSILETFREIRRLGDRPGMTTVTVRAEDGSLIHEGSVCLDRA